MMKTWAINVKTIENEEILMVITTAIIITSLIMTIIITIITIIRSAIVYKIGKIE